MKNFLFYIFAASCLLTVGGVKAQSKNYANITGRWISEEDKSYEVVFTKTEKQDYYNNQLTSTSTYHIQNDSLISADKSDGPVFYYSILTLTKKKLTLVYLLKGNRLVFRKE